MDIPTFNFTQEESLEDMVESLEAKSNLAGPILDSICSLIEPSFENVSVEFDSDSSTIKFISESDKHILDVSIMNLVIAVQLTFIYSNY